MESHQEACYGVAQQSPHAQMRLGLVPLEYCAPSWLWASINSQVRWLNAEEDLSSLSYASLFACTVDPSLTATFCQVSGGFLEIQGSLIQALLLNR